MKLDNMDKSLVYRYMLCEVKDVTASFSKAERIKLEDLLCEGLAGLQDAKFCEDINYLVNTGFRLLQKYRDTKVTSCDKATKARIQEFAENSYTDLIEGLRSDDPQDFVDCWLYNWHIATDDPDAQIEGYGSEFRASYSQAWVKHNLASG